MFLSYNMNLINTNLYENMNKCKSTFKIKRLGKLNF